MRGVKKSRIKFIISSALLIHPEQPWRACNFVFIFITAILMIFFVYIGGVSLYYAQQDLVAFVEIAHAYSFVLALSILLAVHYIFKIQSMHMLFQAIDANIFEYKTEYGRKDDEKLKNTIQSYESIFQNFLHSAIVLALVILAFLAPLLINIFGDEDRKKIEEINYDFPVPLWFPFNTDNLLGFAVAYLLITGEIFVIAIYISSAIPFLVYVAFEVDTQYKILKSSIMNLEQRALERYTSTCKVVNFQIEMLEDDPFYERCIRESLKENILHHIEILRFFNIYQDITSTIYGVIIGVSMVILASLSLVLTKTKLLSFETVKFAFLFIVELIIVFGYCFMGTSLTDGSKDIPNALYNCPWFNLSESQKKVLRIFQNSSGRTIELRGNGIFVIDLQLFVQIVQTTYSIFNIFSSMEH